MEIDRHSLAPEVNPDDTISIDEHDFVPNFQRVSISGEDTSGVPLEDLERASKMLIQALEMREHNMAIAYQSFPHTTGRFVRAHQEKDANIFHHDDKKTIAGEF
jgi:AMP deaminase